MASVGHRCLLNLHWKPRPWVPSAARAPNECYLSTSNAVEHRRLLPVLAGLLHLREEERAKVEATIAQSESGLHAVAGFATSALGSLW